MHYKAMGDLGYTGSLNDRIHKYLTEEYGSFYEALRDLRNGTSVFSLISSYAVNSFDPALVFDFKKNYYRTGGADSTLSSSVTHTRASSATMTNSSGTLVTVGNNVPRTDHHSYNGSAWVNEGVLHESEARTNTATNSNLFSHNNYTKNNISVTASSVTSPDGSNNGWKITPTGTNPYIRRGGSISGNFTHSLYVKKDTADYVVLGHGAGTKGLLINFSFASGTVVDTHAYGSSTTYISNTVENVDNGWYRISVTGNTGANNNLAILPWDSATAPTNLDSSSNASSSTVYIYGAQTEVASTPSSYIPTTGSTVTRAAETLTVPAANMPWPTPVVIGSELITNGTFDSNTNDWTASSSTLSVDSNRLKVTGTSSFGTAQQDFTTVSGKVYSFTANYIAGDVNGYIQIVDGNGGGNLYTNFGPNRYQTDTSISVIFKAVSNLTRIQLRNYYGSSGDFNFWDNVSVKEINPLSVSIQMGGRMTYADQDEFTAHQFMRWRASGSDTISIVGGTNTGDGLRVLFQQIAGGVNDTIATGVVYNEGILVPFNVSSRNGSTFINGATDGTALTADTTPVALPDLSTTDLDLGYDFMGTIGKFRVWSDDLTDSGIAEASS